MSDKRLNSVFRTILSFTDFVSQEDIENLSKNEIFLRNARKIAPSTWRIAADLNNRPKIIEAAHKSLENENADNASYEKAEALADAMQVIAKRMVEEINNPKGSN